MSREDFLRYMAEYGNIYDSPSYEGFKIFISEQNKQIPDRRNSTQYPDTISEEKMDKELSQSGSTHSNTLFQSKINKALVQDGHGLEETSVHDYDKANSEFYCVPELLEKIEYLRQIIKEKDVQLEDMLQISKKMVALFEEKKKHNSEIEKFNFMMEYMEKKYPDFQPSK